jgi:HAD superfamily hydrolase (TIGR01509 family)
VVTRRVAATSPCPSVGSVAESQNQIQAVIFDLDGVLIASEEVWAEVRREFALSHAGHWEPDSQRTMMGMSSAEWAAFMHDDLGVALAPEEIVAAVVAEMSTRYRHHLPLLPGAREAVHRLGRRWPLGLASSANRPLIDLVLDESRLAPCFAATLSTEEVGRGKPAPDVYLEVSRRMGVDPRRCAGVEDSSNGLRALRAAGMRSIAVPNPDFPPDNEALASADAVVPRLDQLTAEVIGG